MRKILILLIAYNLLLITSARSAIAHVLKTDGKIGAVMHIAPNDNPEAGAESGFFFEFKDKENKFLPENCECVFLIKKAGQEIYSQPLYRGNSEPSLTNPSVFYTFPEKNIYKVVVAGKPKQPNAFQQFTLEYDIRVEKTAEEENIYGVNQFISTHGVHIFAGVVGIVLFLVLMGRSRKKK